ncbi:Major facilitator superfamily (MFS) profile domain-containing protein [Cupriavidus oxalaticus]
MLQNSLAPALARRIAWRITPLLMLMYFVCILDRVNLGYASLTMNRELGLTAAQYGLAAGLLYLTYMVFEVPSNILLQKTSPRIWFTRIMVTWGLCSAATGLIQNAQHLYLVRMCLGAAEAGLFPGVLYYLTRWLPKSERAAVTALFMTAAPVAFVIGAPLSGYLMDHAQLFGYSGWRAMLIIEGLVPVVIGLCLPFLLPNRPADVGWLSAAEKAAIAAALSREAVAGPGTHRFAAAMRDGKVWALGFVFFGINVTFSILFWFLPQMVAGFKASLGAPSALQIGLVSAAPFACAAVTMVLFGFWLKGRRTATPHVALPIALAAAGTVIPALSGSPAMAMLGLCLGASGAFCAMVSFWQLPPLIFHENTMASGIALVAAIGVSSNLVIPWLNGHIKDLTGSLDNAMIFNGAVMVVALAVSIVIGTRITRASEHANLAAAANAS